MLDKYTFSIMVECTSFKICCWKVPDNDGGRFNCYHIAIRLVCNLPWNNFPFNTMSVALLAVSSFDTLIYIPFNTDSPVKFLSHYFGCAGN